MAFTYADERSTLGFVHFKLKSWAEEPGVLLGAAKGEQARHDLEIQVRAHRNESEPVGLDFRGIKAMSVPFAESFFVPLMSGWISGYYDEHPIVVFGATEDVAGTVAAVMKLKNMGVLSQGDDEHFDLLGGEASLREAFDVAARRGELTASQLADELGISLPAANNRLKLLLRLGALVRSPLPPTRGGREYVYRTPELIHTGRVRRSTRAPATGRRRSRPAHA